ncbi:ADP-ribose glycohydrolase ARH3-like [Pollicipes pollicipes]|uniref:ADP-ribose glycohydrolase ARH3-like n=1 Tax=Pollicipes pollicipes TaxID=41117 RepID=UPI001884EC4B|nr:ADP-ribose glycohydrolase ARH3-like [Pollicipes pollicipes]
MAAPMVMSISAVIAKHSKSSLRFAFNPSKRCHTVTMADSAKLCSKFRGCLAGALMGDCLGEPFENDDYEELPSERQLNDFFQQLVQAKVKVPYKNYTDDTAMTRCIAESLINKQAFDAKDMATRSVKEYFTEPGRGYGSNVPVVFGNLRKQECEQPFLPAREQFNGRGSFGNGGAMRVAPVALFCHNNVQSLIDVAKKSALITHAHREGYNGAILQCLAVHLALQADPGRPLDGADFIDRLRTHMEQVEECSGDEIVDAGRLAAPYQKMLTVAGELLRRQPAPGRDSVVALLGHDVSALNSVPTAVYCFLRGLLPLPGIEAESPFVRTIQYAISLGGDTDTIGSMAGAIAGAYHGMEAVPAPLLQYCEKADEALAQADALFELLER